MNSPELARGSESQAGGIVFPGFPDPNKLLLLKTAKELMAQEADGVPLARGWGSRTYTAGQAAVIDQLVRAGHTLEDVTSTAPGSQRTLERYLEARGLKARREQENIISVQTTLAELLRGNVPDVPKSLEGLWESTVDLFAHRNPDGSVDIMGMVGFPFNHQRLFDAVNSIAKEPLVLEEGETGDGFKRMIAGDWKLLTSGTGRSAKVEQYLLNLHRENFPKEFDSFAPHAPGFINAILQSEDISWAVVAVKSFGENNPKFWQSVGDRFIGFYLESTTKKAMEKRTIGKPYEQLLRAMYDRRAELIALDHSTSSDSAKAIQLEQFAKSFGGNYRSLLEFFVGGTVIFPGDNPLVKGKKRIEPVGDGRLKVTIGKQLVGFAKPIEKYGRWYTEVTEIIQSSSDLYPVFAFRVDREGKRQFDMRFPHEGPFKKASKEFRQRHPVAAGMDFQPRTHDSFLGWIVVALASPNVRQNETLWPSEMALTLPEKYRPKGEFYEKNPGFIPHPRMKVGPAQVVLHVFRAEEALVHEVLPNRSIAYLKRYGTMPY